VSALLVTVLITESSDVAFRHHATPGPCWESRYEIPGDATASESFLWVKGDTMKLEAGKSRRHTVPTDVSDSQTVDACGGCCC